MIEVHYRKSQGLASASSGSWLDNCRELILSWKRLLSVWGRASIPSSEKDIGFPLLFPIAAMSVYQLILLDEFVPSNAFSARRHIKVQLV